MKLKNRQQILLLVVGAAIALLLLDRVVLSTLGGAWRQRSARIQELRKKVANGKWMIQREMSLRTRWDFMQTNALPSNISVAEQQLLKAFDGWAQESRVTILSIGLQRKREADDYLSLDCRLEASGSLGAISQFLYAIERNPMALLLQNVELSARDNDGQQLALGLQISGLVLGASQEQK